MSLSILLVGCGKMGGAMLSGWLETTLRPQDVVIVEPGGGATAPAGVRVVESAEAVPADFRPDAVVLAVKPQVMADVLPAYRRFVAPGTVFLSVAAGRTLAFFAQALGETAAVVRAMPNTPAAVGRGITVCCPNAPVDTAMRDRCTALLQAVGTVAWVEDEAHMDAVTAVSGSGPAYVFLLAEAMTRAGIAAGLPADLAAQLARATICGAGELMHRSPEEPATLRQNVTSPGGTTAAALAVLMADDGLDALMIRAVAAAAHRSRELAG
ncbi:pyrroline-5-carboxylate reductase [Caenispirillum bisanense]|uniref:pyrroline-5-carboxylate reductase n=1 Tax=Caenispirillum bisanense TaxID=414052 RepID=UPI0031DC358D